MKSQFSFFLPWGRDHLIPLRYSLDVVVRTFSDPLRTGYMLHWESWGTTGQSKVVWSGGV